MNNRYIQTSGNKYILKELETAFQLNSGDKHISKNGYQWLKGGERGLARRKMSLSLCLLLMIVVMS